MLAPPWECGSSAHTHLHGTLTHMLSRSRLSVLRASQRPSTPPGLSFPCVLSTLPRPQDKPLTSPRGHRLFIKALHFLWHLSELGESHCVQGPGFKGENPGIWECDVWSRQPGEAAWLRPCSAPRLSMNCMGHTAPFSGRSTVLSHHGALLQTAELGLRADNINTPNQTLPPSLDNQLLSQVWPAAGSCLTASCPCSKLKPAGTIISPVDSGSFSGLLPTR